jgi:GTPase SAR1 family protein
MLAQARQGDDDDNEDQANIPKMIDPTASLQGTPGPGSVVSVFNVIVVGQAGVGKTGFIKLLIDTSILSSDADMDADPDTHTDTDIALPRLARLAEFANYTATCPTTSLSCATADLAATNQRPRITLNLFDTPGLQFHDPQELERGVNLALRQITDAFGASQSQPALTVSRSSSPNSQNLNTKSCSLFRHRNERTNRFTCTHQF